MRVLHKMFYIPHNPTQTSLLDPVCMQDSLSVNMYQSDKDLMKRYPEKKLHISFKKSMWLSPLMVIWFQYRQYSSLPLIRPPHLPRNCGHIREVVFGEREK